MKRTLFTTLSIFLLACLTATTASATSVHSKRAPSCVDNGLTATCTGILAGLGNYDILVRLTTTGSGDTTCTNPGGNTKVPGQNPGIPVPGITGIEIIPKGTIKNGNAPYTVSTKTPADPTAAQAGCPNNSWTATWSNISFSGITSPIVGTASLDVYQCPGGTYNADSHCVGTNGLDLFGNPSGQLAVTITIP